jgi:5-methylcytosine-specific restriction endonuclease McrA
MAHVSTLKICSQCGKDKPWTAFTLRRNPSGTLVPKNPCKDCKATIERKRRQEDPDKERRVRAALLTRQPNYLQQWREEKREHLNAQAKKYREANLDKARAKANKWHREHPWVSVQNTANRRARKRNQFVEKIDPHVVYETHNGICGICERFVSKSKFHVDHIIPISKGGLHCYANVQPAHPFCNMSKHDKILPNTD